MFHSKAQAFFVELTLIVNWFAFSCFLPSSFKPSQRVTTCMYERLEAPRLTRLSCKQDGTGFAEAYKLEGVFYVFVISPKQEIQKMNTSVSLKNMQHKSIFFLRFLSRYIFFQYLCTWKSETGTALRATSPISSVRGCFARCIHKL